MYTDTHAHFSTSEPEIAAVVKRARAAGVTRILAVGGSPELNAGAIAAARLFPRHVRFAAGWDRDQAGKCSALGVQCSGGDLAAIGEIGLDYHHRPETHEAQGALFGEMLKLAGERSLPVIVHTREADADTLRLIDECGSATLRAEGRLGVVHCFTGGEAFARQLLNRGLYISFSGIFTFRNADALRQVARFVPADRLLIETDSPFLAPVPMRGRSNEPAFIVHVAQCVAERRGVGVEALAEQTTRNAETLFGTWNAVR